MNEKDLCVFHWFTHPQMLKVWDGLGGKSDLLFY